ncbi:prevent-host-death protein [Micromonospora sp. NPDC049374]|uniref:prevent-host-death protein n=1 Tax=Micromonospora sp. NPDC049374 TaxID=3154352 RepID=UPI00343C685B
MSEPAAELPISDARDSLADVVSRAHYAGRITYVPRRGQRLAAITPGRGRRGHRAGRRRQRCRRRREALTRIDAGDTPIPLTDLRDELGL